MEYLQPYVYNVVRSIIKERQESGKFPYVAIHNDILRKIHEDIMVTISEMETDGVIAHSENVNGIYLYRINNELENENNNVQ